MTQTSGVRLCKASRFSYGESPRTPPLEGTSLHRRRKNVCGETLGDLEPVYDLFTTTGEFTLPEAVTQTSGVFVKQVVFLTVNHRGPLPLRELHSTDEKNVCGETLGDLEPVYDPFTTTGEFTLPEAVTQTSGVFVK